jgi:hypothetical protein
MRDEGQSDDEAVVREAIFVLRRSGSNRALVLSLMQQTQGASVDDLLKATGWLPQTTRAALSGLRKQGSHRAHPGSGRAVALPRDVIHRRAG